MEEGVGFGIARRDESKATSCIPLCNNPNVTLYVSGNRDENTRTVTAKGGVLFETQLMGHLYGKSVSTIYQGGNGS